MHVCALHSPARFPSQHNVAMSSSLVPTSASLHSTATTSLRGRKAKRTEVSLTPEEFAKAVQGYSRLATGAGQNHTALGEFLANGPTISNHVLQAQLPDGFITLYQLGVGDETSQNETVTTLSGSRSPPATSTLSPPSPHIYAQSLHPHDSDVEADSSDERRHKPRKFTGFHNPVDFLASSPIQSSGKHVSAQARLIFMRGYMSASWINNLGARYLIDPEFFCRHLDFRRRDDPSNTFSTPALPSSSWHLIELPVMSIGVRTVSGTDSKIAIDRVERLRDDGTEALTKHHHRIARLSSSDMAVGESMYREFYMFDETHFAVEQRISICLQLGERGAPYTVLVWLDSGADYSPPQPHGVPEQPPPWAVPPPKSYHLPIILHKHMIALKWHLAAPAESEHYGGLSSTRSASHLPTDYGRSLRPNTMARDALYSLNEVFALAASSQVQFLNLIDTKLDGYTSDITPIERTSGSLPNLRYTKQVMYHYIHATRRVLDSIRNASTHPKWPRDTTDSGSRKADAAAQSLIRDFEHLLQRAEALDRRATEAINVLMSSISISESQKAIEQAERVGKLTFLAFIFIPLSFTTSLFGMNVTELEGDVGLKWWFVLSVPLTAVAVALFYWDVEAHVQWGKAALKELWVDFDRWLR